MFQVHTLMSLRSQETLFVKWHEKFQLRRNELSK